MINSKYHVSIVYFTFSQKLAKLNKMVNFITMPTKTKEVQNREQGESEDSFTYLTHVLT